MTSYTKHRAVKEILCLWKALKIVYLDDTLKLDVVLQVLLEVLAQAVCKRAAKQVLASHNCHAPSDAASHQMSCLPQLTLIFLASKILHSTMVSA